MTMQITSPIPALQQILDQIEGWSEPDAKEVKLPHDPVACACASYRVWKENPARRWENLETVVVWQDDIEEAERLKKYYRERMVVEALKNINNNGNRSSFRRKLAALCTNQLAITQKELGLLHRLPYFYAEDQALDQIVELTDDSAVQGTACHAYTGVFTPLTKILVSRSAGDFYHYWFTDGEKTPYNFVIKGDNPLRGMFESLYNKELLSLHANIYPKTMRGFRGHRYYQLGSVELA